ncbi:AmpG family muropeptide MFS transporter [Candidatus Thiodiazotropha endoloripes]|uniref:AmpG family muropeptide MFS transporter n=1 Tax=Candidatus Thiodiazotropha endoloripes TaxID=1818881 RepID=UPI00083D2A6B|nr:MFS transporter [Candidatus Thiodiazotropha endoloripes]ODB83793.1 AmpG family muropeptide MFS transporter [Candidatus Thiodiazotropha endoloripes]ODB90614.1 AmpG family muropeptide MFS transporter [Candidatus Thiodiazotropha endoloripes]ODB93996.1 AmpG family muropeptide MFS transporter [Candidatus Thiodiazotropha endoloripes]
MLTAGKLSDWRQTLSIYWQPGVRNMLFLGFSAGLPLLLVFGTLSFWLREAGIARSTIGFLSWVALAYGFKWVWAPLVDRMQLPWLTRRLGRRRGWMIFAQGLVILGLCGLALSDPLQGVYTFALLALLVAFASATQDIAIDAYRIESAEVKLQGYMAANYMIGYRLAMIVSGGGALGIAGWIAPEASGYQLHAWTVAYLCMALLMFIGVITVLLIAEPDVQPDRDTLAQEAKAEKLIEQQQWMPGRLRQFAEWMFDAVVSPFVDFIRRYQWQAVLILALIATYRISDVVLGVISSVFYVDLGFSKGEVALVVNVFGIAMTLIGAVVGGMLVARYKVMPILLLGGVLAAATNLLFAWMASVGHNVVFLTLVISADNLSAGLATAAFVAYLSSLTNVSYSATQYALFSSVMLLLPKFIGGFSGLMVDNIGYTSFFMITASMGIPVIVLILLAMRYLPAVGVKPSESTA